MARTAKKYNLSLEEKLDRAFVPDVEQLFRLPGNWTWCYLDSFSTIKTGKKDANYGSENGQYPFFTCAAGPIRCEGYSFEGKAIILAGNGDIGNIFLYDGKFEAYQRTYVLNIDSGILTEYVYYYFKYKWVDFNIDKMFGTAIPYIRLGNLQYFPVPLPPFAEQQRIVDCIEFLFAQLDEAKEKAQTVIDGYEDRKAAILHKAFSGELTAEWRQDKGVYKSSWELVRLSDVCKINPSKKEVKNLPDGLEVSFFPMSALSEISGTITDTQTRLLKEVRTGFTNFSEGDVVFAKITPCMENGKSAVIGKLINGIGFGTTEFFVLRCGDKLNNRFLWYLLRSSFFRAKAKTVMSGAVGQQRVPKNFLEKYPFALPIIDEQCEIVRILDNLLEKEQKAKQAAEQVIEQIDAMKKSILARAFRGELGTNDPTDEPANELLKSILENPVFGSSENAAKEKSSIIPKVVLNQLSSSLQKKLIEYLIENNNSGHIKEFVDSLHKINFIEVDDCLLALQKKGLIKYSEKSGEIELL